MKKVIKTILKPFYLIAQGFNFIMKIITSGFYFYFSCLFHLINKVFKDKFYNIENFFRRRQNDPDLFSLILIYTFSILVIIGLIYVPNQKTVTLSGTNIYGDTSSDSIQAKSDNNNPGNSIGNLYQKYGMMSINDINFDELKATNSDVVLWIMVDGTNINYPVVQTNNNDYYLKHNILKRYSTDGWVFLDFRNSLNNDRNTIFYGHNLLNKTSFGSISKMFTKNYLNNSNHQIYVIDNDNIYIYKVFSIYYSQPVTDYLQVEFYDEEYLNFLNNLKNKSKFKFNEELTINDKIITLSTCTDDNTGRKVVHAKLIGVKHR